MKKIAVVAYSAPPYSAGGVASAHFNLMKALRRQNYDAHLFTFGDWQLTNSEHITRSGTYPWLETVLQLVVKFGLKLLQLGKSNYHTATIIASQPGAHKMARQLIGFAPDVVILSDHGAPGLALSQADKVKMILVSHHNPERFAAHETMSKFSKLDARLANWLEQRVVDKVSAVICPSNYMRDWFKRSFHFSRTLEVIPNLLDENWLDSIAVNDIRPKLGMPPDDTLVYIPSPGSPLKGSQHLLSIVDGLGSAASKQIGFYIPGEIPIRLQKELLSLPSSVNIYMPGQQPYEEHIALMKACSFGISPSLMENYSMALLEAVLSGLPMLAFDTGGNSDIIHSGMNGYLVDEGDLKTLIQKAGAWMKGDGLKEKRTATREFSRSHLSSAQSLQAYVDLIETL